MCKYLYLCEKVKNIRKKLGVTQKELGGNTISRTTINRIETNCLKRNKLSKKTASALANNIKRIAKEKNIKLNLEYTAEYFINDSTDEYWYECLSEIDKAVNFKFNKVKLDKRLKEIEKVNAGIQHKVYKEIKNSKDYISFYNQQINKVNILLILANEYKENYCYKECINILLIAGNEASKTFDNELYFKITIEKIRLYLRMHDLDVAASLIDGGIDYYKYYNLNNSQNIKILYYDKALELNWRAISEDNYEYALKSIECLDKIKKYDFSKKEEIDIKNLYAQNYKKVKNYEKAESIYLKLIDVAFENKLTDQISMLYRNISMLYIEIGKIDEAKSFLEKAESLKISQGHIASLDIHFELLIMFAKCNFKYEKIYEIFDKILYECSNCNNVEIKNKSVNIVIDYLIRNDMTTEAIDFVKEILAMIEKQELLIDDILKGALFQVCFYFKDTSKNMFEVVFSSLKCFYKKQTYWGIFEMQTIDNHNI